MNVHERLFKLWAMIGKMILDDVRDAEEVADALQRIVDGTKEKVATKVEEVNVYLKQLFAFTLNATDGKYTYATARKVFRAYFDPEFENWGIVFSGKAPAVEIVADELVRNGQSPEFPGSTAVELEKCRILGSQFLKICRDARKKLQINGHANFFVLTWADEVVAEDLSNVFVARVEFRAGMKLFAYVYRFDYGHVWHGSYGHRIFSSHQAA